MKPLVLCCLCALVVTCEQAPQSHRHYAHKRTAKYAPRPTPAPAVTVEHDGQTYKF